MSAVAHPHLRGVPSFDAVLTPEALSAAWGKVLANGGCAGTDGESLADFSHHLATRLWTLYEALQNGTYRPHPPTGGCH